MPLKSPLSPAESEALTESPGRHLRKVLQSLLGESEAMIPGEGTPSPDGVHDIRVNMKRSRAILKLLKAAPGVLFYKRENCALRDISLLFSPFRESDVLNKTLKILARKAPDVFDRELRDWFRQIARDAHNERDPDQSLAEVSRDAAWRLRRAWYRIGFLNLRQVTRETLLDGLWNSFLRAEGAYRMAADSMDPFHIHEFRKRTKDLLYQVRFFSDYNPGHFDKIYERLDVLGSLLGKCNDLTVAANLAGAGSDRAGTFDIGRIMAVVAGERDRLFREAIPHADFIFRVFYSGE